MFNLRHFLLIVLLTTSASATAANNRATDAAFAALLSMPSAKPANGSWTIPALDDFKPTSEAALIAYLARQQAAGADVNAYRHQGSLLHHAIRAGLPMTAEWLLAHGADPTLKVRDSGLDALGLSLGQEQVQLAGMLQNQYHLTPPAPVAVPVAPVAPTLSEEREITEAVYKYAGSPSGLDQALAAIAPATLQKHRTAALHALASVSSLHVDEKSGNMEYTVPAQSWRVMWRHLGQRLDYGAHTGLAQRLQPELWPQLMASGYVAARAEDALGCLLADIDAAHLKSLWPDLTAQFPDVRQSAAGMVLASYRMRGSHYCYQRNEAAVPAKLALLTSLGIHQTVAGLSPREMEYAAPALKAAIAPFMPQAPALKARLVDATPTCAFTMTDTWYAALTGKEGWPVDSVQLLEIPGVADCALLAGGYERFDEGSHELIDGFFGPEREPKASCPDPADVYELWRPVDGKIIRAQTAVGHDDTANGLIPVRDSVTGKRYYLNDGRQNGKCHGSAQRLPFAFEWQGGKLVTASPAEIEDSLFQQCRATLDRIECPGIAALSPGYEPDYEKHTLYEGVPMQRLLRGDAAQEQAQHLQRQNDYVAAIMALDRRKLKAMQANGVSARSIAAALNAVSASALPLSEKRRRAAWLFHDHAQLAQALDDEWTIAMLDWLPYEDWQAVLQAMSAITPASYTSLDRLREAAHAKGMTQLSCDIDNARQWICGETISAEP